MKFIYTVHFYQVTLSSAIVYLIGFYDNLEEAKGRLSQVIPDYEEYINNTVIGCGRVGWINRNTYGDLNTNLSASQPHSSINLFEEESEN